MYSFVESWKVEKVLCRHGFQLEKVMREEIGLRMSMRMFWGQLTKTPRRGSQMETRRGFARTGLEGQNWIDEDALQTFLVWGVCLMSLVKTWFGLEIRFLIQSPLDAL